MAVRVKLDGFRALAFIESGSCRLVSRKAQVYKSFSGLCQSLGHLPYEAVLDGEIVCLDCGGCPQFDSLFYRRGEPNFYAFDVPYLDGRDLRGAPLVERKRILGESFRDRIRDCSTSAILRAAELICFGKSAPTISRASSQSGNMIAMSLAMKRVGRRSRIQLTPRLWTGGSVSSASRRRESMQQ